MRPGQLGKRDQGEDWLAAMCQSCRPEGQGCCTAGTQVSRSVSTGGMGQPEARSRVCERRHEHVHKCEHAAVVQK